MRARSGTAEASNVSALRKQAQRIRLPAAVLACAFLAGCGGGGPFGVFTDLPPPPPGPRPPYPTFAHPAQEGADRTALLTESEVEATETQLDTIATARERRAARRTKAGK
jgi:hypothetical protein